jgi:hypothetical protein
MVEAGLTNEPLPTLAEKFRALMSHDMKFDRHGRFRQSFYQRVYERIKLVCHSCLVSSNMHADATAALSRSGSKETPGLSK